MSRGRRQAEADVPREPDQVHGAEDALRAMQAGEVDALVVRGPAGDQVFMLQGADRTYRIFLESMQEGAATLSPDGIVLFANRRLADMLRLPIHRLMGASIARFLAADDLAVLEALRDGRLERSHAELVLLTADGGRTEVLVGMAPLTGDGVLGLTVLDLTEQRSREQEIRRLSDELAGQLRVLDQRNAALEQARAELHHRALHDGLTGLPNRDLLKDRLRHAVSRVSRREGVTALLFIDLDRFKPVNDALGHEAGDAVLRETARRLEAAVRPTDTVCRFGGDEFIVMATGLVDEKQIVWIGERVLEALTAPHPDSGLVLGASIGVSTALGGAASPERMLREADTAMYQAKAKGGNRLEFFDDALGRQAVERLAEERIVREALSEGRIVPYYQPIMDLRTRRITGLEALARLELGDGSVLLPTRFVPVSESTGLIVPMGAQILRRAGEWLTSWRRSVPGWEDLRMNVNVSPRQLSRGNLLGTVLSLLGDNALPADALQVEITESAVVDAGPESRETLRRLHDAGVRIGLDDFGTGYASLTELRRLPIDFVKIDRSFIRGLDDGGDDGAIVAVVIDLARRLRLRSVAEGVEDPEQERRLADLGCDEAQGYLYSEPLRQAEVAAVLTGTAGLGAGLDR